MMRKFAVASAALLIVTIGQPGMAQEATSATTATAKTAAPKPVDIESDQMEIRDKEMKAIFRGGVIAKRPGQTLNCDTLVVDYGEVKQADGSTRTDVTKLDAQGHVVIVTVKETITGEWAKMDVKSNILEVGGSDVTVKQGATILRGKHLDANLDTGQMELTGGRVKGSFLPK